MLVEFDKVFVNEFFGIEAIDRVEKLMRMIATANRLIEMVAEILTKPSIAASVFQIPALTPQVEIIKAYEVHRFNFLYQEHHNNPALPLSHGNAFRMPSWHRQGFLLSRKRFHRH